MNLDLFLALNAGTNPSPVVLALALFFSKYAPYLVMGYCVVGLIFGAPRLRKTLLLTVTAALVAAVISWVIGKYLYMPRPFVESVGSTLLAHKDNASFPSNHAMFMTIFATVFLLARQIKVGLFFGFLALCIGWSRVFLGVHYPVDIAGGILLGVVVSVCVWRGIRFLLRFE
ncbi:MAG TPA: hypothetical protein DEB15_10845 [Pusillimonas sp.]|jgi:undecaprenyl-diphosphatase|nr:hypothetical protein [Pusillimonas sp.]|tara:strand:+ start:1775 stop:2290 length:516 start_codon:yes stop_codon:yes gene_type:complete